MSFREAKGHTFDDERKGHKIEDNLPPVEGGLVGVQPIQWLPDCARGLLEIYIDEHYGVKMLTSLGVNYKEYKPDEDAEHVLVTRDRKARNIQVSPEAIFPYILVANV